MSGIFSKPKMPKVKNIPVPSRTDAETQSAAEEERRRQFASSRGTGWLTGGLGVPRSSFQSAGARLLSGQAAT